MFSTASRRAACALLIATLACGVAVGVVAGREGGSPASPDVNLSVNRGSCGPAWTPPSTVPATFQIYSAGTVTDEVDLIDPGTGGVYAEIEGLAPGATRPMRLRLGTGDYAFRCLGEDTDAAVGPTVHVNTGDASAAPAIVPVTIQDMYDSVRHYRAYITAGLNTLAGDTSALAAALHGGDLSASRSAWLTAHLAYQRLGAAYGTFDDFADKIDGLPYGLPGGVDDPDYGGLRRIEYGLWHGQFPASLAGTGDRVAENVNGLRAAFPKQQTDPNDLPLCAHEILENAERFELTGDGDMGSGTGLATVDANLDGTQAVLDAIAPVLKPRYPGWDATQASLSRLRALVEAQHHPDGSWTPVESLASPDRERLDAAMGQALEQLAPIAAIGEIRRTQ